MMNPNPPKPDPKAAIIVYGRQHAEGLPQAAWFRSEDKQAAKAGAAEMRLSVIELKSDAEKALAIGVHEGVLKGSGRMIVGAVEPEVYRRIEEHVSKQPAPATPSPDASSAETAAGASTGKPGAVVATAPGNSAPVAASPTQPWQALQVGDTVLAAYWNDKREPEGWWVFSSRATRSRWVTPRALASSYSVMTVGLRIPRSSPLKYCWLKPERAETSSWVKPLA
jgi:hypothetical protein